MKRIPKFLSAEAQEVLNEKTSNIFERSSIFWPQRYPERQNYQQKHFWPFDLNFDTSKRSELKIIWKPCKIAVDSDIVVKNPRVVLQKATWKVEKNQHPQYYYMIAFQRNCLVVRMEDVKLKVFPRSGSKNGETLLLIAVFGTCSVTAFRSK